MPRKQKKTRAADIKIDYDAQQTQNDVASLLDQVTASGKWDWSRRHSPRSWQCNHVQTGAASGTSAGKASTKTKPKQETNQKNLEQPCILCGAPRGDDSSLIKFREDNFQMLIMDLERDLYFALDSTSAHLFVDDDDEDMEGSARRKSSAGSSMQDFLARRRLRGKGSRSMEGGWVGPSRTLWFGEETPDSPGGKAHRSMFVVHPSGKFVQQWSTRQQRDVFANYSIIDCTAVLSRELIASPCDSILESAHCPGLESRDTLVATELARCERVRRSVGRTSTTAVSLPREREKDCNPIGDESNKFVKAEDPCAMQADEDTVTTKLPDRESVANCGIQGDSTTCACLDMKTQAPVDQKKHVEAAGQTSSPGTESRLAINVSASCAWSTPQSMSAGALQSNFEIGDGFKSVVYCFGAWANASFSVWRLGDLTANSSKKMPKKTSTVSQDKNDQNNSKDSSLEQTGTGDSEDSDVTSSNSSSRKHNQISHSNVCIYLTVVQCQPQNAPSSSLISSKNDGGLNLSSVVNPDINWAGYFALTKSSILPTALKEFHKLRPSRCIAGNGARCAACTVLGLYPCSKGIWQRSQCPVFQMVSASRKDGVLESTDNAGLGSSSHSLFINEGVESVILEVPSHFQNQTICNGKPESAILWLRRTWESYVKSTIKKNYCICGGHASKAPMHYCVKCQVWYHDKCVSSEQLSDDISVRTGQPKKKDLVHQRHACQICLRFEQLLSLKNGKLWSSLSHCDWTHARSELRGLKGNSTAPRKRGRPPSSKRGKKITVPDGPTSKSTIPPKRQRLNDRGLRESGLDISHAAPIDSSVTSEPKADAESHSLKPKVSEDDCAVAAPVSKNPPESSMIRRAKRQVKPVVNINSLRHQEMQSIRGMVEAAELHIKEVEADGHCLFRAIGLQLHSAKQTSCSYRDTRNITANFLAANRSEFEPFWDDGEASSYTAYIREIRSTSKWGGQMELLALSKALNMRITVYSASTTHSYNDDAPNERHVCLTYHLHDQSGGAHYNAALPKDRRLKKSISIDDHIKWLASESTAARSARATGSSAARITKGVGEATKECKSPQQPEGKISKKSKSANVLHEKVSLQLNRQGTIKKQKNPSKCKTASSKPTSQSKTKGTSTELSRQSDNKDSDNYLHVQQMSNATEDEMDKAVRYTTNGREIPLALRLMYVRLHAWLDSSTFNERDRKLVDKKAKGRLRKVYNEEKYILHNIGLIFRKDPVGYLLEMKDLKPLLRDQGIAVSPPGPVGTKGAYGEGIDDESGCKAKVSVGSVPAKSTESCPNAIDAVDMVLHEDSVPCAVQSTSSSVASGWDVYQLPAASETSAVRSTVAPRQVSEPSNLQSMVVSSSPSESHRKLQADVDYFANDSRVLSPVLTQSRLGAGEAEVEGDISVVQSAKLSMKVGEGSTLMDESPAANSHTHVAVQHTRASRGEGQVQSEIQVVSEKSPVPVPDERVQDTSKQSSESILRNSQKDDVHVKPDSDQYPNSDRPQVSPKLNQTDYQTNVLPDRSQYAVLHPVALGTDHQMIRTELPSLQCKDHAQKQNYQGTAVVHSMQKHGQSVNGQISENSSDENSGHVLYSKMNPGGQAGRNISQNVAPPTSVSEAGNKIAVHDLVSELPTKTNLNQSIAAQALNSQPQSASSVAGSTLLNQPAGSSEHDAAGNVKGRNPPHLAVSAQLSPNAGSPKTNGMHQGVSSSHSLVQSDGSWGQGQSQPFSAFGPSHQSAHAHRSSMEVGKPHVVSRSSAIDSNIQLQANGMTSGSSSASFCRDVGAISSPSQRHVCADHHRAPPATSHSQRHLSLGLQTFQSNSLGYPRKDYLSEQSVISSHGARTLSSNDSHPSFGSSHHVHPSPHKPNFAAAHSPAVSECSMLPLPRPPSASNCTPPVLPLPGQHPTNQHPTNQHTTGSAISGNSHDQRQVFLMPPRH